MITIEEVMKYKNFCVVGDTLNSEKYAYKILNKLKENNYNVSSVYKGESLNDIKDIEVINLCINPVLGLNILKNYKKEIKCVLLQPNTYNDELISYLEDNKIPYLKGCSLIGCDLHINKSMSKIVN